MVTFTAKQQRLIAEELENMPPDQVNEILESMKEHEAQPFLEYLGHVRAAKIYAIHGIVDDKKRR